MMVLIDDKPQAKAGGFIPVRKEIDPEEEFKQLDE